MSSIGFWFQAWTAYFRCSFISDTYRFFQRKGSLLSKVRFKSHIILLALLTAWVTCSFHFMSSATITPKSLSMRLFSVFLSWSALSSRKYNAFRFFLSKFRFLKIEPHNPCVLRLPIYSFEIFLQIDCVLYISNDR